MNQIIESWLCHILTSVLGKPHDLPLCLCWSFSSFPIDPFPELPLQTAFARPPFSYPWPVRGIGENERTGERGTTVPLSLCLGQCLGLCVLGSSSCWSVFAPGSLTALPLSFLAALGMGVGPGLLIFG